MSRFAKFIRLTADSKPTELARWSCLRILCPHAGYGHRTRPSVALPGRSGWGRLVVLPPATFDHPSGIPANVKLSCPAGFQLIIYNISTSSPVAFRTSAGRLAQALIAVPALGCNCRAPPTSVAGYETPVHRFARFPAFGSELPGETL